LSLEVLRGKIVLLDFWTYCCINCAHLLPDLKRLEQKHARELVVIGVHSAKFQQERETENIRQAVLRHQITHPVVNDRDFQVWSAYGVHAWPTLVLITPEGMIHCSAAGEEFLPRIDSAVAELIGEHEARGTLNRRPVAGLHRDWPVEGMEDSPEGMRFPGKLLIEHEGRTLFVADSGHHRVLEVDLRTQEVRRTIGSGLPGLMDGPIGKARFRNPQGLALDGTRLLIADADNHAIRECDLVRETVRTVAGTGEQGRKPMPYGTRLPGRRSALNSPWDLICVGETLYVAMCGCHQIWRLDLDREEMALHVGTGQEGLLDGPHTQATLAQPSGITTDGKFLYIADSEVSGIRRAGLGSDGELITLVGTGLFDFGHQDGSGDQARLQHPLGIVWHQGRLYIADTYNSAIRRLDPGNREVRTLSLFRGSGQSEEGWLPLYEPGGIAAHGECLYLADTGHHRVVQVWLETGESAALGLRFAESPARSSGPVTTPRSGMEEPPEELDLEEVGFAAGPVRLNFDLRLPDGYRLNHDAPFELSAVGDGEFAEVPGGEFQLRTGDPVFPIGIPLFLRPGRGVLRLRLFLYYCELPGERLCYYQTLHLRVPLVALESSGVDESTIVYQVEVPSAPI
jgi:thiol-disulfide isomerase/thioredoxin